MTSSHHAQGSATRESSASSTSKPCSFNRRHSLQLVDLDHAIVSQVVLLMRTPPLCVCVLCNLDPAKDVFSPRWGQFSGKARKANTTSRFGIDVCYFCVDVCHFCVILVSCFLSRTCCFFLRHVFWRDGRKTSFQGPGVYIYIYVYIIYIYMCV